MTFVLIRIAYCHSYSGNNFTVFAFLFKEFKWRNSGTSHFSGSSTKSAEVFFIWFCECVRKIAFVSQIHTLHKTKKCSGLLSANPKFRLC